jgi:hypothetical protein
MSSAVDAGALMPAENPQSEIQRQIERQEEGLRLRFLALTFREIGIRLGITPQGAHQLVNRALRRRAKFVGSDRLRAREIAASEHLMLSCLPILMGPRPVPPDLDDPAFADKLIHYAREHECRQAVLEEYVRYAARFDALNGFAVKRPINVNVGPQAGSTFGGQHVHLHPPGEVEPEHRNEVLAMAQLIKARHSQAALEGGTGSRASGGGDTPRGGTP